MSEGLEALIARVDERTANIIENQKRFEEWVEKQDKRIYNLEACQNRWIGKETAVAVIGSVVVSLASVWAALNSIFT